MLCFNLRLDVLFFGDAQNLMDRQREKSCLIAGYDLHKK